MEQILTTIRGFLTLIVSVIVTAIGGVDDLIILLLMLSLTDVATGFINAAIQHNVSSKELKNGAIRKCCLFVAIILAVEIDKVVMQTAGHYIQICGKDLLTRTVVIVYFILEELISVLENLSNIGVPVPKWLRSILKQVSETANNSTPQVVIDWIKKTFKITIITDKQKENNDEKSESLDEKDDINDDSSSSDEDE